jgi:pimeloyl-ACP methyl ester carboxylesterase
MKREIVMNTVRSSDGTTIAYSRVGTGPALILVGGAFQYRAIDQRTDQLAALLAPDFTVSHYDRRGRGDSGDTAPYAPEREIEDLAALIRQAGEPALVFGNSSGAALVLDAAAHGLGISKLAVYEPPFVVDGSRPPVPEDYLSRLEKLLSEGRRGDAVELFMTEAAGVPAEFVTGMRQAPFWPAFEAVAHTLPYDGILLSGTVSGGPLPRERWAGVTTPVLVIDGGASPDSMHNGASALVDLLPSAGRHTIAGQEHDVDPALLAPVLRGFFAG